MRGPFLSILWMSSCALLCTVLAGCAANAPTPRGEVKGAATTPAELAQSDMNRVATLAMHENLEGLFRLMDKLYRRNPAEWRKTSATSRTISAMRFARGPTVSSESVSIVTLRCVPRRCAMP